VPRFTAPQRCRHERPDPLLKRSASGLGPLRIKWKLFFGGPRPLAPA